MDIPDIFGQRMKYKAYFTVFCNQCVAMIYINNVNITLLCALKNLLFSNSEDSHVV